jgi:L-cysteine S-thiosulfotransferase
MVRQHYRRDVWLRASAAGMMLALSILHIEAQAAGDQALSAQAGDPVRGRAIAIGANQGNCIICHAMPVPELAPDAFGNIGPSLAGVGSRETLQTLRARIVNPQRLTPDTVMPAYFARNYYRVQARYAGKTILSAQDVEDVVAYLASLK